MVNLPVDMPAVFSAPVCAADGADCASHAAAHAHLFFDAAVNFQNKVLVSLCPRHISFGYQPSIGFSTGSFPAVVRFHLCIIDTGTLRCCVHTVVENSAFPPKQFRQLLKCLRSKAFPITVHFIVTQHHFKGVHFFRGKRSARIAVDFCQIFFFRFQRTFQDISTLQTKSLLSLNLFSQFFCLYLNQFCLRIVQRCLCQFCLILQCHIIPHNVKWHGTAKQPHP